MIRILLVLVLLANLLPVRAAAEMFDEPENTAPVPYYDPDSEAVRSLILPGWSQFRQGQSNAGFGYASVAIITMVFVTGIFDVPALSEEDDSFGRVLMGMLYGLNAVVSGFDANRRASESNREHGWDLDNQALRAGPAFRLSLVRMSF